jgi:hypothetical protein
MILARSCALTRLNVNIKIAIFFPSNDNYLIKLQNHGILLLFYARKAIKMENPWGKSTCILIGNAVWLQYQKYP